MITSAARAAVLFCGAVLLFPAGASGAEPAALWSAPGLGGVEDVVLVDGKPVIAGNGVGQVTEASLTDGSYGWVNREWPAWDTTTFLTRADLDGDGRDEVISGGDAGISAVSSTSGQTLWKDDGAHVAGAVADFDGDGSADVAYGSAVDYEWDGPMRVDMVRGATGAPIATHVRDWRIHAMDAADLNLDGVKDLVVVGRANAREEGDLVGEVEWRTKAEVGVAVIALSFRGGKVQVLWETYGVLTAYAANAGTVVTIDNTAPAPGPEVVVGSWRAAAVLSGLTGAMLGHGRVAETDQVVDIDTTQLDLDPYKEVVAGVRRGDPFYPWELEGAVYGFDGLGAPLWNTALPLPVEDLETADVAGTRAEEILVSGGRATYSAPVDEGFVHVLRGSTTAVETVWTRPLTAITENVTVGRAFGQNTILATQDDGLVAFDGAGAERWRFRSGGYREDIEVADLDGDGTPEILEGSSDGYVAARDAAGAARWQTTFAGHHSRRVGRVGAGELSAAPGREVVAATSDHFGRTGSLRAFDADGHPLWSTGLPAPAATAGCPSPTANAVPNTVRVSDVDGDGRDDVLAAGGGVGSLCTTVARLDGTGAVVWAAAVHASGMHSLDLVELNGDGVKDLVLPAGAYWDGRWGVYALDGRDGSQLWRHDGPDDIYWTHAGDGLTAVGTFDGTVALLEPDGTVRWEVSTLPTRPPGVVCKGQGAFSVDADGDGVRDLLVAQRLGTKMLSGADGSEIWSAPTGGSACSVATLLGGARPVVAIGESGGSYEPSVVLVDAETGEELSRRAPESTVIEIVAADLDGDGAEEAVVAAGSDTLALESGQ